MKVPTKYIVSGIVYILFAIFILSNKEQLTYSSDNLINNSFTGEITYKHYLNNCPNILDKSLCLYEEVKPPFAYYFSIWLAEIKPKLNLLLLILIPIWYVLNKEKVNKFLKKVKETEI